MARGSGSRDRTAPVVTITSPANGQIFLTSSTISITATATDNKAVTKVEFYVKNNSTGATALLATDTISPYSAAWPVSTQLGIFTLTAKAYDAAGNTASHSVVINRTDSTTTTTTSTTIAPPPTLPTSKILITPPAFAQGGEGSCQGQSIALIRSIEEYYTTNATSYSNSTNIMSAEWLFNTSLCGYDKNNLLYSLQNPTGTLCNNCGPGSFMVGTLQVVYDIGVPTNAVCPYSSQDGCTTTGFTQTMIDNAAAHKSTWYASVLSTDLYSIKRLIVNNHALSFAVAIDSNFYNSTCGYIWNSKGSPMGNHAMTIVGYDDSKNAWLIQNSWGTSWGCNGQAWVDYNFFATICGGLFWMTTRVDKNPYPIL
jgi:hypothetical protein